MDKIMNLLDWPEDRRKTVLASVETMMAQGWGEAEAVAKKYEQFPRSRSSNQPK